MKFMIKEDPIVDTNALDKLNDLSSGDGDLLSVLIGIFNKSYPPAVHDLRAAAQQKNVTTLSDYAHNLKSTCATLGLCRATKLCKEIEILGSLPTNIDTIISNLELELQQAAIELQRIHAGKQK